MRSQATNAAHTTGPRGPALVAALMAALTLASLAAAAVPARDRLPARPDPAAKPSDDELLKRYDPDPPSVEKPDAIKNLDVIEKLGQRVPLDLTLVNSDGRTLPLSTFFDGTKPVLLLMVYYRCPMQCSTILQRLAARLNQLDWRVGDKFNVVVVSFDPTELPEAAAKARLLAEATYVRGLPDGKKDSLAFLTASAASSRKLADSVGFQYRFMPESGEYAHAAVEFVLTPDGRVSRYLYGIDFPADRLRFALLEATDGKIGSTIDRILHYCFRFDPHANEYVVQAFRVMQLGAGLTVACLGGLFAGMWMVERRRRRTTGVPPGTPAALIG